MLLYNDVIHNKVCSKVHKIHNAIYKGERKWKQRS